LKFPLVCMELQTRGGLEKGILSGTGDLVCAKLRECHMQP